MHRHIIIKLLKTKDKEKCLKGNLRKMTSYQRRRTIQMTVDVSSKTMEKGKKWHNISSAEGKNSQHKILYQ